VLMRQGGRLVVVVWPHSWSVKRSADGVLTIVDDGGAPAFRVGEDVLLGGGELGAHPQDPPERFPEELIGRPIPSRCKTNHYYITSGNRVSPSQR
jgi:hypothetical protein